MHRKEGSNFKQVHFYKMYQQKFYRVFSDVLHDDKYVENEVSNFTGKTLREIILKICQPTPPPKKPQIQQNQNKNKKQNQLFYTNTL